MKKCNIIYIFFPQSAIQFITELPEDYKFLSLTNHSLHNILSVNL